jgi:hypothetical protein
MKTRVILCLTAILAVAARCSLAADVSLETAPPVVVKTVPVAGATDVDPALTEIKVTYSKAMQDGSWSWSTWGQENYPETTGKPRYLADARTCVLPVKLLPGKFYAIWLNSDKFQNFTDVGGRAAVPYLLTFFTAESGASQAVTVREINRLVSAFPTMIDLSTPESACAAWQRANVRKDAQTVSQLSLVPIDAKEQEEWYRREEKRDAEGLAVYLKALADAKILTVQVWRKELANVVTFLPFPEGKGRHPYSSRSFGLVNGAWKNLGEDRLPDLESAKTGFDQKKERLWQQFSELKAKTVSAGAPGKHGTAADTSLALLNEDQRAVLAWTDRQFRSYFDARTFEGWSAQEKADLESKSIDALSGPRSQDYYRAINTLGALRSTKALPALRGIAYERADRNNRDRWMAIRALGLMGDKADVPELIHLVYHGNVNTRWWAQLSLVRITGKNFGKDWNAWGKWWNDQKGEPPYKPEIIRWWDGQADPDKLAQSLEESDAKFLADLKGKSASTQKGSPDQLAAKLKAAEPTMTGIRENWTATVTALDSGNNAEALAAAQRLTPHIQDFLDKFRGTSLEPGTAKALDLIKSLATALEKDDQAAVQTRRSAMATLGRSMEEQIKAIVEGAATDSFARCRIASFGGEKSEGVQSYGGSGPALRFKPAELLSGIGANTPVKLKGVRLYASRYGRGYAPEEATMRVILRDAKDSTLGEASFAYAKFGFDAAWVDLVFEQPLTITQPGESITLAFDPEATQTKGIYFHYQKNPTTSHSLVGTVSGGFKELPDREWLMRVAFE